MPVSRLEPGTASEDRQVRGNRQEAGKSLLEYFVFMYKGDYVN